MPPPAISSRTWRNPPPSHMGKWIARPRTLLGRQRPPDLARPQEVSSLQTPLPSIRFQSLRQAEFSYALVAVPRRMCSGDIPYLDTGSPPAEYRIVLELSIVRL